MSRVWPQQQRLVRDLRDVLRGSFGCRDAWVIAADGRYRLEVRVADRQITLLNDDEERFWSRFYTRVQRSRAHLGEQVTQTLLWRKSKHELTAVLSAPWLERVGPPPARAVPSPAAPRLPRA